MKSKSIRSSWTQSVWFFLTVIVLMLTTIFGSYINPILRYDRDEILVGEIWRLITGHFVHLGTYHAFMNLFGFILIRIIFPKVISNQYLLVAIVFMAVSISFALLISSPQLDWYLGFSGVLHGLFAYCIVLSLNAKLSIDWVILLVFIFKIVNEQLPGYDANYLADYIHAPVAVDAHLYGFLAGIICSVLIKLKVYFHIKH